MLSASEIAAQIIGFLLLLLLLRIFAWKKILGLLDERKARIASEFKNIEDTKNELSRLNSEYAAKMAKIEEAANRKIQEAIAEGRKITDEVRKKAHEEAQDIINNAKENIRHELSRAKEELKEQVIDLSIKATEAVIREKLTGEDDRKIINEFLEQIDEVR